jgi:predicted outer membrane protein
MRVRRSEQEALVRIGAIGLLAALAVAPLTGAPAAGQVTAEAGISSQIDAAFLTQAAQQAAAQVLLAQLVVQRAETPEVLDLARALAATGLERGQTLSDLAWAHGLVAPTSPDTRGRATVLRFAGMPAGPAFEHEWTLQAIAFSNASADLFQSVANTGRWPDVQGYARQQVPVIAAEKAAAQQVEILLR